MKTSFSKFMFGCFSVFLLSQFITGCAKNVHDVSTMGPDRLMHPGSFEKIDLVRELDPATPRGEGISENDADLDKNRAALVKAFKNFYDNPLDQNLRRNRIQDRMIAASNHRCGFYTQFLKQFDVGTNLALGGLATALGGVGAIVTGETIARTLAGASGITSGLRSEVNSQFFANLSIQVITNGFESKRREIVNTIKTQQQKGITEYSVEAAIADAINYHSNCSLTAGLEHAGLSIERTENPGMKGMEKALILARRVQRINSTPIDQPVTLEEAELSSLQSFSSKLTADFLSDKSVPSSVYFGTRAYLTSANKNFVDLVAKVTATTQQNDDLIKIKGAISSAKDEAMWILETYKNDVDTEDRKIRDLHGEVSEEIDATEIIIKRSELVTELLRGREISGRIQIVGSIFQNYLQPVMSALQAEKGTVDEKIASAKKFTDASLAELSKKMVARIAELMAVIPASDKTAKLSTFVGDLNSGALSSSPLATAATEAEIKAALETTLTQPWSDTFKTNVEKISGAAKKLQG